MLCPRQVEGVLPGVGSLKDYAGILGSPYDDGVSLGSDVTEFQFPAVRVGSRFQNDFVPGAQTTP